MMRIFNHNVQKYLCVGISLIVFLALPLMVGAEDRTIKTSAVEKEAEGVVTWPRPDETAPPVEVANEVAAVAAKIADTAHKMWRQSEQTDQLRLLAKRAEDLSNDARRVQKLASDRASADRLRPAYQEFRDSYQHTDDTLANAPRDRLHRRTASEWDAIVRLRSELDEATARYFQHFADRHPQPGENRLQSAAEDMADAAGEFHEWLHGFPVESHLSDNAHVLAQRAERLNERTEQDARQGASSFRPEFNQLTDSYNRVAEQFERGETRLRPELNERWRKVVRAYGDLQSLFDERHHADRKQDHHDEIRVRPRLGRE